MATDLAADRRGAAGRRSRGAPSLAATLERLLRSDTARLGAAVSLIAGVVGLFITVGADSQWLAALGHAIVARGSIPAGVPFAAGPTVHWPNTLALAELVFDGLEAALGERGLALAELVAVAAALMILARDARAGDGRAGAVAGALAIAAVGAFPSLTVVRVQMFSLVLFPLLIALLRAEARVPSRRIWLALPLLALWSNLHGAAISGVLVLECYLLLARVRPDRPRLDRPRLDRLGVDRPRRDRVHAGVIALLAPVALCATPAGIRTLAYYHGLLTNAAAVHGVGQWAPLGTGALDCVLIAAAALLALRAVLAIHAGRWRASLWEVAVVLVFAALTVKAARDGVWLLFLLVAPAAHTRPTKRTWDGLVAAGLVVALPLLAAGVTRTPDSPGASAALVQRAVRIARGAPILADSIPAEQVALAGGRIWAGNPLDAFTQPTQLAYLAWVDGTAGAQRILDQPRIAVVLASRGSSAAAETAADAAFRQVAGDGTAVLFERR